MGYSKKDNLDLNHMPATEDVRTQRRIWFWFVPFILFMQVAGLVDPDAGGMSPLIRTSLWAMIVLVIVLALTGWAPFGWGKTQDWAALEDEITHHHRAKAFRAGFVACILSGVVIAFAALWVELAPQLILHVILSAGLTVAAFSFAWLEREDFEEE
ncbi:hypothetical protein [Sphingomicrobium arenosum]|uniref:hypothetical protein n=1 Tax=Sphingomicrobium arenosum TaxID=2233861 RepID=UPI002240EE4F|nr:hypothetical protein [Sphingomicrobium arenosum]